MKKSLIPVLKFLGFLSIGLIILFVFYHFTNKGYLAECATKGIAEEDCSLIDKLWSDILGTKKIYLFGAILVYIISNLCRALRSKQLITAVGYDSKVSSAFWSIMLGYGANLLLPRAGEVARAGSFSVAEDVPFDKTMGTIVLERIIDVLCLLIIIGLSVVFAGDIILGFLEEHTDPDTLTTKLYLLGAVAIAGLIGIFLFFKLRQTLSRHSIFAKIYSVIDGFGEGIKSILKLKNPVLFTVYTLIIWFMYYFMYYLMFLSFEPTAELGWIAVLVTFVFGSFGIVIPSPGGMGTYHFLVVQALGIYNVSSDNGFSFANISFFLVNLFGNILFAVLALFFFKKKKSIEA